jgi:hypothetical protein
LFTTVLRRSRSPSFLRDATECSAYALLLFGGDLEVEARKSVISIDGWVKLSVNTRIKSLVWGLRAKMDDSKPFLRDATEYSAYALLLFGGDLDVEARKSEISIDGWVKLSVNARSDLLTEKIKDPTFDISGTSTMRLVVTLLAKRRYGLLRYDIHTRYLHGLAPSPQVVVVVVVIWMLMLSCIDQVITCRLMSY